MDIDKAEINQNPRWKTGWSQTWWLHMLFRGIANKEKKGEKSPLGEILILLAFRSRRCLLKIVLIGETFRKSSCPQWWHHCKCVDGKQSLPATGHWLNALLGQFLGLGSLCVSQVFDKLWYNFLRVFLPRKNSLLKTTLSRLFALSHTIRQHLLKQTGCLALEWSKLSRLFKASGRITPRKY